VKVNDILMIGQQRKGIQILDKLFS